MTNPALKMAYALGGMAKRDGVDCTPSNDHKLMSMIYSVSTPDHDNLIYTRKWIEGWNNG